MESIYFLHPINVTFLKPKDYSLNIAFMKRTLLVMLIASLHCYGQKEFQVYSNGLIYDQATMKKLGHIVDSLNLKFKTCSLAHPYYGLPQGMATYVSVPSKAARKLIEDNATLEAYLKSYPRSLINKNLWVLKSPYENYKNEKFIEYSGLPFGYSREPSVRLKDEASNDKISGWIFNTDGEEAFYLSKLEVRELPAEYARLVQYVDCMIDTTADIYFPNAKRRRYQEMDKNSKAYEFITWAENFPDKPEMPDHNEIKKRQLDAGSVYDTYFTKYHRWDSLRMIDLDTRINSSPYWKNFLKEAVDEGTKTGNSDERLELYARRYLDGKYILKAMRSHIVVGNCSMDQSPRYHAMNICKFAAETAQWDIFLRSHLDIMNDRFERVSDGSYAWDRRNTYLKELEQLDINAVDLLLGTALRVNKVSDHHYFGSIGRLGRALANTEDKDALEKRLLSIMQYENLDLFNRLLITYLFDNYSYNLEDASRKEASKKKLTDAIQHMPESIRDVWKKRENQDK
jgi:hypothetical protein